jgi:putative endonuclease
MTAAAADGGVVYELHFEEPIGDPENPRGQARHYIGHTEDLDRRVAEHRGGHTAAIMRAVKQAGIGWRVVRTWPGTRDTERQIKLLHSGRRLCPECTEHPLTGAGAVARAAALRRQREAQAARAQRREARLETQRAEQGRRGQAAREAAAADPYEDGRRMARQWLATQDEAGRTADQIEAAHEYVTGPWAAVAHRTDAGAERYRGYTESVRAALEEFREYEGEQPRPHEMGLEAGRPGHAPAMGGTAMTVDEAARQQAGRDEEAVLGPDHIGQGEELDGEFDADGNPAADSDADAAHYEHDVGSWLARDGDTVREVAADGTPGREASPDDGRPIAEAGAAARGTQVTCPDGSRFVSRTSMDGLTHIYPTSRGYTMEPLADRAGRHPDPEADREMGW